jgi:hypothetical protein
VAHDLGHLVLGIAANLVPPFLPLKPARKLAFRMQGLTLTKELKMEKFAHHSKVSYQRRGRHFEAIGKPVTGFVLRSTTTAVYIHDNATGKTVAASRHRVGSVK